MKYQKPLIMLMDCDPAIAQKLEDAGYNVLSGSFGRIYEDIPEEPIKDYSSLPNGYSETDIVVIDLVCDLIVENQDEEYFNFLDEKGNTIQLDTYLDYVDPRPLAMSHTKDNFDRVLEYGGVFIIFADKKFNARYYSSNDYNHKTYFDTNNWDFLSYTSLNSFIAQADEGFNIKLVGNEKLLTDIVNKYLNNCKFTSTVNFSGFTIENWIPIAANKYNQPVSGILLPPNTNGKVFIFPHFEDKSSFIHDFIENYLPEINPELFPNRETRNWIEEDIYQPLHVLELKNEIRQIEEKARQDIEALSEKIDTEKKEIEYLSTLLTGTDNALERAVEQSLRVIGFKDVLNYDNELRSRGNANMREDLHIRDGFPWILVEIKGVTGTSTEAQALQVGKYLFPRSKELGHNKLRGLSIINHQRNFPLSKRTNNPFTTDTLENAAQSEIGLLTTWNLYRLVRSYIELGWTHEAVRHLFYKDGFIDAFPSHYEFVGVVERYIPRADISIVGIKLNAPVRKGDRLAFELDTHFKEQILQSLQYDNKDVEQGEIDQLIGTTTTFTKQELKVNTRVFRVNPLPNLNPDAS